MEVMYLQENTDVMTVDTFIQISLKPLYHHVRGLIKFHIIGILGRY